MLQVSIVGEGKFRLSHYRIGINEFKIPGKIQSAICDGRSGGVGED